MEHMQWQLYYSYHLVLHKKTFLKYILLLTILKMIIMVIYSNYRISHRHPNKVMPIMEYIVIINIESCSFNWKIMLMIYKYIFIIILYYNLIGYIIIQSSIFIFWIRHRIRWENWISHIDFTSL